MVGGSVNFHILPLKLHGGVKCILRPTLTLSSALPVGSNEPNFKMYYIAINSYSVSSEDLEHECSSEKKKSN